MQLHERESRFFFPTYKRLPIEIARGEGVYLIDNHGRRYLDLFGGLAVNALGYIHPRLTEAIEKQLRRYLHLSNFYLQDTQIDLADRLLGASGYAKIFLCNSGTEAIEGSIKIARRWGKSTGKSTIVSFSNAFHGRTMGALSSMDRVKFRDGFEPFLPGFTTIPYNNIEPLRQTVGLDTVAVMLELIQGEGGIVPANPEFVEEIFRLRSEFGFLVIADEIQSGLGRTGKLFAFEHYGVRPDIIALAKPLGGGLPLGAILGSEGVAGVLEPGVHGTTFGGNPVACAAGIVVIDELTRGGLIDHVAALGAHFKQKLEGLKTEFPQLIAEVRGLGLMMGVQLKVDGEPIVTAMRDNGVLINCTGQTILRILPPLIIQKEQIDEAVEIFRTTLDQME